MDEACLIQSRLEVHHYKAWTTHCSAVQTL